MDYCAVSLVSRVGGWLAVRTYVRALAGDDAGFVLTRAFLPSFLPTAAFFCPVVWRFAAHALTATHLNPQN